MRSAEGTGRKDCRSLIVPGSEVLPSATPSNLGGVAAKLSLLSTNAKVVDRAPKASLLVRISTSENAALENQKIKNIAGTLDLPGDLYNIQFFFLPCNSDNLTVKSIG